MRLDAAQLLGYFPLLALDQCADTSDPTPAYNCIAWAAGDDTRWWSPADPGYFWPWEPGPDGDVSVGALVRVFEWLGFTLCSDAGLESGFAKVLVYANGAGEWTHAARQLRDGTWTSKLGPCQDIRHARPECLTGAEYGSPVAVLRRPTT